jgi:hypothetical protein
MICCAGAPQLAQNLSPASIADRHAWQCMAAPYEAKRFAERPIMQGRSSNQEVHYDAPEYLPQARRRL